MRRFQVGVGFAGSLAIAVAAAAQCEREWLSSSGLPGVEGLVRAMCSHDLGTGERLWVGGSVTAAGGVEAAGIAAWDGEEWAQLGAGLKRGTLTGTVSGIVGQGSRIVAGGWFDLAGDVAVQNVAAWDGAQWIAMGAGLRNPVSALAEVNGTIFAATTADGVFADPSQPGVHRWDGEEWIDIAPAGALDFEGVRNAYALTGWAGRLAVAYRLNDEAEVRRVAMWDGQQWESLPASPDFDIDSLVEHAGELYCAGSVDEVRSTFNVRRWTGAFWAPVGGFGPIGNEVVPIQAMTSFGGHLWIAGDFPWSPSFRHDLYSWNGSQWTLYPSVSGNIFCLAAHDGSMHIGGSLQGSGNTGFLGVASWAAGFHALGEGTNGGVRAFCELDGDLYVGGSFRVIGGVQSRSVARWDGRDWWPASLGNNGYVTALANFEDQIVAMGDFTFSSQGVASPNIARWDGQAWRGLGTGVTGEIIWSSAVVGEDLYVGGRFSRVGGIESRNVGRWDGAAWSRLETLNGPVVVDNDVWAVANFEGDLIVGGLFRQPTRAIGRYNGQTWQAMSPSQSLYEVEAIAVHKGELYIAGSLSVITSPPLLGVAKWDGSRWVPVGNGIGSTPLAVTLASTPAGLIVCGLNLRFGQSEESEGELRTILLWDGEEWVDIAGDSEDVFTAYGSAGVVFAGGYFDEIAGVRSARFAEWRAPLDVDRTGIIDLGDLFTFLSDYFRGIPRADWDQNGSIEVDDLFAFLSDWFGGCP